MTKVARGTFEVKISPLALADAKQDAALGRMAIDKQFHGDLEGTASGEMLTAGTAVEGSAGYVAIERVSGSLHGRRGSLVLQHNGLLARGAPSLTINVVPDSGSGELTGLTGTMTIDLSGGMHAYELAYSLGEAVMAGMRPAG